MEERIVSDILVDHNPMCLGTNFPLLTTEAICVTAIHIPGLIDVSSQLVGMGIWEVCKMGGVGGMRVSHCEFSLSSYLLFFLQTWDTSCVS